MGKVNAMDIKAALLKQSGGHALPYADTTPLEIADLKLDAPQAGELLLRIDAAGLCHSDLSVVNGDRERPMPMALGHEATGIVEAVGSADTGFDIGDRVILAFLPSCGECTRCTTGEPYMCGVGAKANGEGVLLNGGYRLHNQCGHVHHHLGLSAFATHTVVDRRSAVKVDKDIPAEIAALFGCAVLTGAGAVFNSAAMKEGESVLVYGLGGVGLSALLAARAIGASTLVAIDPAAEKRAIAEELGAIALSPDEAATKLAEIFPESGPDLVIETVGRASVLVAAYQAARRGGRICTVGLPNPAERFDINALSLVAEGKTLIGSYMGSAIPSRDIPRYIDLWKAGRLPVEKLLSSINPLADINHLMDELHAGRAIRQVMIP